MVKGQITVAEDRPDSVDAVHLLAELDTDLHRRPYPPESRHAFSIDRLIREGVVFFIIRYESEPAGCGAIKLFGTEYGEVKRMFTQISLWARDIICDFSQLYQGGQSSLRLCATFRRARGWWVDTPACTDDSTLPQFPRMRHAKPARQEWIRTYRPI